MQGKNEILVSITYILLLLSGLSQSVAYAADVNDYNIYLDSLDQYIHISDRYVVQKENRISALKELLKDGNLSLEDSYRYTYLLFEEYSTYKSNLMYTTARQLIDISNKIGDYDKLVQSKVQLAHSYLWCGAFKEAYEYMSKIDTVGVRNETKANYLMALFNLQFESALYVKPLGFFMRKYVKDMQAIILQLEKILPADDDRLLEAYQKQCSHNDQYKDAWQYLNERLKHTSGISRETAAKLGDMGFLYLEMGDTVSALKYMVKSAIMDIKIGSKQAPALRKIAEAIYPKGEINRAYEYIQQSMANAVFFDSRYRMYESSITLPLIDKELYELTVRQKDFLVLTVCVIILFIVVLVVAVYQIWKQNCRLRNSALLINKQNESLKLINEQMGQVNRELQEANNIKEAYLGRILSDTSLSISDIEELVKVVKNKVKAKQYDDIMQYIYKHDYLRKRKEMLSSFDEMFLRLFPNFIEKFNSLLDKDNQIIVHEKNVLTPELRIFALIRLGVTKSDTIGEILNYSASTVRNYKTKIRNISIVPNEEFDSRLLDIQSEPYNSEPYNKEH